MFYDKGTRGAGSGSGRMGTQQHQSSTLVFNTGAEEIRCSNPVILGISYADEDINLEAGAYRVEIEVDPENRLGENPALRDNNKFVRYFDIK